MKYYAGIDLGGTNIAVGIVDENYQIVGKAKKKTNVPRPAEEIADDMAEATRQAAADAGLEMSNIEWVGIGTPGVVNQETGEIEYSNNLRFDRVPMVKLVQDRLGLPVYMENDANAATYGEALAGAAKGVRNVIGVTLGTGVGGGIIIDGKIYSGSNYAAGELGHTVIVHDGRPCTCGRKGCFESYASATGLIAMTREYLQAHPEDGMWHYCDNDLAKVNGRTAFEAMRAGLAGGKLIVDKYLDYLGCGIMNMINIFQPDVLFIGGGISKEGETILAPLRRYVERERYTRNSQKNTEIVAAKLGNDAGIIGAAFLGKLHA